MGALDAAMEDFSNSSASGVAIVVKVQSRAQKAIKRLRFLQEKPVNDQEVSGGFASSSCQQMSLVAQNCNSRRSDGSSFLRTTVF